MIQRSILSVLVFLVIGSWAHALSLEERSARRSQLFQDLHDTPPSAAPALESSTFRPVATWSGRLILPTGDERRDDGGVYLELQNWDHRALPVETPPVVALLWPGMPYGTRGFDVRFTERVFKFIEGRTPGTAKVPAPWRLNGMDRVSALESLAGHRPTDDVVVALKSVQVVADARAPAGVALVIDQEPVQVSGSRVALVTFLGRAKDGALVAVHWDPEQGRFDDEQCALYPPTDVPLTANDSPDLRLPQSSVAEIWNSPLNPDGWYAYVHVEGGKILLDALEPRAVLRLQATDEVRGESAGRRFVEEEHWSEEALARQRTRFRSVLLLPDGAGDARQTLAAMDERGSFLVLNLFGWWGRHGKPEREQALRSGHFALGFADVVDCPFTGERRLAIEYKQVYGMNNEDIIGGSMTWAHYNGDLRRGWMYLRPTADALVDFEPLTRPYQHADRVISVRRVLEDKLERVMAAYRTGAGQGVSVISEMNSCSQDSTQGTFLAFEELFADGGEPWAGAALHPGLAELRAWAEAADNDDDAEAQRWRRLRGLYGRPGLPGKRGLSGEFFRVPWGVGRERVWRDDWLANLHDRSAFVVQEASNDARSVLGAYASSRNSLLPRQTFDTFAKLFLNHQAPLLLLQTVQVGGSYEGLLPLSPEKLNWEKVRGLVGSVHGRLFGH